MYRISGYNIISFANVDRAMARATARRLTALASDTHLKYREDKGSWWRGWSSAIACLLGQSLCDRNSWSWTRWRVRAVRLWARRQSRTVNRQFSPTRPLVWNTFEYVTCRRVPASVQQYNNITMYGIMASGGLRGGGIFFMVVFCTINFIIFNNNKICKIEKKQTEKRTKIYKSAGVNTRQISKISKSYVYFVYVLHI